MKRSYVLLAAAMLWGCANSDDGGGSGAGGSTGKAGTNGAAGTTGAAGRGGTTGAAGSGTTGAAGTTGTAGTTGAGGASAGGTNGAAGATGAGGAAGTTAGTAGHAGTTGAAGTTGIAGSGGHAGTTGAAGAAGHAGTTGAAGTTGIAGTTGSALPSYVMGADITDQEPAPTAAINNLLSQMKSHGFNFVRLRTFVNPKAADGYDQTNGYDDITHTVTFGALVKAAGMGLLIDFHMSDNWADPGKQCVPVSWQGYTNITDLSTALHDYVKSSITSLIAGGARPDMVQIGNETTPGMLLHTCDSGGLPTPNASTLRTINGSTSNWTNLGMLLNAGVKGVKDVDTGILISFHIDRGNAYSTTKSWLDNAIKQGANPDAFGESCYQQYQGDVNSQTNTQNGWQTTFSQLVTNYPKIRFFAAEYGPMERQINDVVFGLPNNQGMGTFDWEPTSQGSWNAAQPSDPAGTTTHALFQRSGNTYTDLADLPLYTTMMMDYAARL